MIWILLVVYQLKHFLADYPLQGRYMLGKFKPYPAFILPLLSHGLVHGVFTFLIALCIKPWQVALVLGVFDMTVHSIVDYLKANPSVGGRFQALSKREMVYLMSTNMIPGDSAPSAPDKVKQVLKSNTYFWWALGADQLAHHLTHYLIIWALLP